MESIGNILAKEPFAGLLRQAQEKVRDSQRREFERVRRHLPFGEPPPTPDPRALADCPICHGYGVLQHQQGSYTVTLRHPDTGETLTEERPSIYNRTCACVTRQQATVRTPDECGLVGDLATMTLEGVDLWRVEGSVYTALRTWTEALPASLASGAVVGVLLSGAAGVGKSGLMASILHQARLGGVRCRYVREVDIVKQIRATYDGEGSETAVIEYYERVPLLAIDDVGKAYVPPRQYGQDGLQWLSSILYAIIDERTTARRPTLLSTNLDESALVRRLGDALADRLNTFEHLTFSGSSRRRRPHHEL